MDRWTDGLVNRWMDERMDEQSDRLMGRHTEGQMSGWMDRQTNRQPIRLVCYTIDVYGLTLCSCSNERTISAT